MIKVGIDVGGTLMKLAYTENGRIVYNKKPVAELKDAADWINGLPAMELCVTGGKAAQLRSLLRKPSPVTEVVEFAATVRGARHFLEQQGLQPDSFILTNVGTGTSIHHVRRDRDERVGGSGVGGGTIMGLTRLLTGLASYEDIVEAASSGTRQGIDITVADIYEGAEPPIPGSLTASNFGKVRHAEPSLLHPAADLAASVLGLVGETAATLSLLAAGQSGTSTIVYVGSTFANNSYLKKVIGSYTELKGASPVFFENGEYCGAMGALLHIL